MDTIITIGRQTGSGGREIGRRLSVALNIPFFDKELLQRAAKDSGFCEEIIEHHDERPTNSFLYSLIMDTYSYGISGSSLSGMPIDHKVFLAQYQAIRKAAEEGPCVIVGRCADYALADNENLLSVFVMGKTEDRIKRLMDEYPDMTETKIQELMIKTDKKRSSYYNYYSNKSWGSAFSYNLAIDSSVMGIDGCVDIIVKAIEAKEKLRRPAI